MDKNVLKDFFFGFGTVDQFQSLRFTKKGDIYIQKLANALEKHGKSKEFRNIMDEVKRCVKLPLTIPIPRTYAQSAEKHDGLSKLVTFGQIPFLNTVVPGI